jgi:two-component system chemotaxis response regulator CheB
MFRSLADLTGVSVVGLLLPGMGRDGAQGRLTLRQAGGDTLAQNEATCVACGMPKVAMGIGAAQRQLSVGRFACAALGLCEAGSERMP